MSWVADKVGSAIEDVADFIEGNWEAAADLAEFLVEETFDLVESAIRTLFEDVYAPILKPVFDLIGIEDETIYSTELITTPLLSTEAKYFKTLLLTAIRDELDVSEQVRLFLLTGQKATAKRFLTYGKNHYIDGIPNVTVSEYFSDAEVVQGIIETEYGETITIDSIEFSNPNIDLWCKYYLLNNNNYSLETNEFVMDFTNWKYSSATLNGLEDAYIVSIYRDITTTIIVDDYTQVLIDGIEYTDTWTRTTTQIDTGTPSEYIDNYVDTNYVRTPTSTGGPYQTTFVNISTDVTPSVENSTLDVEVPIYNAGGYYGVVFSLDSAPTVNLIWFYSVASGVYPELDNSLIGGGTDNLDTLPILELRNEFINVDSDKTSERYLTTKKALDILNIIRLDDLLESLESNPDINLIQDAFIGFFINLYTEDQHSLRYLFNFFMMLSVLPKFNKASFLALSELDKSNSTFIYKITEGRYNATLSGNYIEITEINGYIGNIGYVETEFTILPNTEATVANLADRTDPTQQQPTDSLGLINSSFTIRTQLTNNTYLEVEVNGLMLTTLIYTQGSRVNIKAVELVDPTTGSESAKNNFGIPISYYLLDQMNPTECEQIIYDSISLMVYAEQVVQLEYYETEDFFQLINLAVEVVNVVLIVISLGQAAPFTQALFSITKQILVQAALTFALKKGLSSSLSDAEKAVLLLLYLFGSQKSLDFLDTNSLVLLADRMLLAINSVSTFFQIDTENKTNALLQEQAEFESLITTKDEEISAANEWLTFDATIDTFNLLNSRVIPVLDVSSTPQEFYEKSLLVNLAPILLSQPSTYVETVLDLDNTIPRFDIDRSINIESVLELT